MPTAEETSQDLDEDTMATTRRRGSQPGAALAAVSRHRRLVAAGLAAVVVVAAGVVFWRTRDHPVVAALDVGCTVVANNETITLDNDQAGNAAIISAVAVSRHLPAHAATIALAAALQESKLRNLTYGDRDSLGLFQQRPSSGWGTKAQVRNPVHASNAFYDALVRVPGYRTMAVTKAAQRVQRSAYPSAYAQHEPEARVLASAMTGNSPAAVTCVMPPTHDSRQQPSSSGLTARAGALATAASRELGATATLVPTTGGEHSPPNGTVVDLSLSGTRSVTAAWAVASWAVARGQSLHVVTVTSTGRTWSRTATPDRWTLTPTGSPASTVSAGHVQVQVS